MTSNNGLIGYKLVKIMDPNFLHLTANDSLVRTDFFN